MSLLGPIKGETYDTARKRLSRAMAIHYYIVTPPLMAALVWASFGANTPEGLAIIEKWFFAVWSGLAIYMIWFFWQIRDVMALLSTSPFTRLQSLFGKSDNDPLSNTAGELPAYLCCAQCGSARVYNKWLTLGFHESCPSCQIGGLSPQTPSTLPDSADHWNRSYIALTERIEKWGSVVTFVVPLLTLLPLLVGGAVLGGRLFPGEGAIIGGAVGVAFAVAIYLFSIHRLIGFFAYSDLKCPECQSSVARYASSGFSIDWQCRRCTRPHARKAGL